MDVFNSKGQAAGAAVMGGGFVATVLHFFQNTKVMLWLLGGILVAALLVGLVILFVKWRKRKKGDQGTKGLMDLMRSDDVPADRRQEMADLERKLSSGVEKLKGLKMNLYDKPWYVIIGEPGSGKSEAIRQCLEPHCPPSLQDPLQGTGGTINMDWWFTNYAIMLDTAGEMTVPDAEAGAGQKWSEFLGYLAKFRPHEPVNGIFLAIPADSLVMDDDDKVRNKARHISQRLNEVQSKLDVRVPVYLMITKADLVVGFREFFNNLVSGRQQDQLFGWCNPDPLDQAFDPTKLRDYLSNLVERVSTRRMALLDQAAGDDEKRLQAATLYAFPDNLRTVTETLGTYLQMIFPPPGPDGKVMGQNPLFVRGVFFTSSLQKGAPLDRAVMDILGEDASSVNFDDRAEVRKRSYFLADLFLEKAFKEFGLVTHASNARRNLRVRQMVMLGAIILAVTVLIGFTWYGGRKLEGAIGRHRDLWIEVKENGWDRDNPEFWRPLLCHRNVGGELLYDDSEPIEIGRDSYDTVGYLQALHDISKTPIEVPSIFRLSGNSAGDDLQPDMVAGCASLFDAVVTKPLVERSRDRFGDEDLIWGASHTAVLQHLLDVELAYLEDGQDEEATESEKDDEDSNKDEEPRKKNKPKKETDDGDEAPARFGAPFFDVLLEEEEREKASEQEEQLGALYHYYYSDALWPPVTLAIGECSLPDNPELEFGITHFAKYALEFEELQQLQKAIADLKAMQAELTAPTTVDAASVTPDAVTASMTELLAFETTALVDLKDSWLDNVEMREDVDTLSWFDQLADFDKQSAANGELIAKLKARQEALTARKATMLETLASLASLGANLPAETAPVDPVPANEEKPAAPEGDEPAPEAVPEPAPSNPFVLSFQSAMDGCKAQMGKRLAKLQLPELTGGDDAECQNELVDQIRTYFDTRREKATTELLDIEVVSGPVEAVDKELEKLSAGLEAAQAGFASLETRRKQMYQLVLDERAKTYTIETYDQMAPSLNSLCEAIGTSKSTAVTAAGEDKQGLAAAARTNELLDLIYRYHGSTIAQSGLDKLADLEIADLVKARAEKIEIVKDDPLPWDGFDSQFHPRAAAALFGELAQITNPKFACKGELLNARDLKDLYGEIQDNIEDYLLDEFVDYWSLGVKEVFYENARRLDIDSEFPEISFMSQDIEFKPEFHARAATGVRAAFTICEEAVADSAMKAILSRAAIEHAEEHLNHWVKFVDQRRQLNPAPVKWQDLHSDLTSIKKRAYRVPKGFKKVVEHVDNALRAVTTPLETKYAEKPDILKNERGNAAEALAILEETQETLDDERFLSHVEDVIEEWAYLPSDANDARQGILKLRANELSEFLVDWEFVRGDLVREYWRDINIMIILSLRDPDAPSCTDEIKPALGFPLLYGSRKDLSKSQIEEVRSMLVPCQPCQQDDETVRCKKIRPAQAERAIAQLRPKLSDSEHLFMKRCKTVADAALGVRSCVVRLKDLATQKSQSDPAFRQWDAVKFAKGNRYKIATSNEIDLDQLTIPGDGIDILFFQFPGDETPNRKFTLPSAWQPIRFLFPGQIQGENNGTLRWGDATPAGDGKRFTVKLQVSDDASAGRPLVLEFEFSKPLPDMGEWPE